MASNAASRSTEPAASSSRRTSATTRSRMTACWSPQAKDSPVTQQLPHQILDPRRHRHEDPADRHVPQPAGRTRLLAAGRRRRHHRRPRTTRTPAQHHHPATHGHPARRRRPRPHRPPQNPLRRRAIDGQLMHHFIGTCSWASSGGPQLPMSERRDVRRFGPERRLTALIRWAAVSRGGDPESMQRPLTLRTGDQPVTDPALLRLLPDRDPDALPFSGRPAAGTLGATTELRVSARGKVRRPAWHRHRIRQRARLTPRAPARRNSTAALTGCGEPSATCRRCPRWPGRPAAESRSCGNPPPGTSRQGRCP